jgi:23S rRNA pseudouridine2605 synthase
MVFKRPGNSRDDKSNRSPSRATKGDDQSKKAGTSRYSKPSNSSSDKLKRNHYSSEAGSEQKSGPSIRRKKPYSGRPESGEKTERHSSTGNTSSRSKSTSDARP